MKIHRPFASRADAPAGATGALTSLHAFGRPLIWFATLFAAGLALVACVGPGIQARVDVVRGDIVKARKSGAYRCAPRELAMAEANADFTETELVEGDFLRAQEHIEIAVDNIQKALIASKGCGPRRVTIRKNLDKDGDGIVDKKDACPERPEDFDGFEDEDGCPDPDNDQDKILDPLDKCPNEAEDMDGFQDDDGCPDGDMDGDGFDDAIDKCPKEPEDKDLFEDEDGCPEVDNDKDTVLDNDDRCPNTFGPVENQGCPVDDRDGDSIPDAKDTCPDKPEDFDGDRDTDGCPDIDTDGDGFEDDVDQCPNDPEDKDGFEDEDGCPEADNDQDGILDATDACPDIAGPLEARGCPDQDSDGFPDNEDKCPTVPGVDQKATHPEKHGCPRSDRDGDTIFDDDDKCPDEPGVANMQRPELHGCPIKDTDGDGIYDSDDKCPKEVGVAQPDNPEQHGCPKKYKLIVIKKNKIEIKQQVKFETGKAIIKAESFALLAEVSDAIKSSNITRVYVDGHTDSVGSSRSNQRLSEARANAVRDHMIDREGVDADTLVARGYGEEKPIASNRSRRGRAQNRRVEFNVER